MSRECALAHSSSPGSSLSPIQEAAMTLQPHRLEFKSHWLESIFAMVLAITVATILTITTWAAPRVPESDSAAPIPPIYPASHPSLYLHFRNRLVCHCARKALSGGAWNLPVST